MLAIDMVASCYQCSKCAMLKRFGSSVDHFRGGVKFPGLSANFSESVGSGFEPPPGQLFTIS